MSKIKSSILLISLLFLSGISLHNCKNCDDCQISPSPKQVKVLNKSGENLIYGSSSVYDVKNIAIKNTQGETVEFFANNSNGSIDFTYSVNSGSYFIDLSVSDRDTISFVYGKDKHVDCCSSFDVTDATTVNGKTVENTDNIIIVK